MIDLDKDLNLHAFSKNKSGRLPVICKCGVLLTTLELNNKCTIDANIECRSCGNVWIGTDLWAELAGKI